MLPQFSQATCQKSVFWSNFPNDDTRSEVPAIKRSSASCLKGHTSLFRHPPTPKIQATGRCPPMPPRRAIGSSTTTEGLLLYAFDFVGGGLLSQVPRVGDTRLRERSSKANTLLAGVQRKGIWKAFVTSSNNQPRSWPPGFVFGNSVNRRRSQFYHSTKPMPEDSVCACYHHDFFLVYSFIVHHEICRTARFPDDSGR